MSTRAFAAAKINLFLHVGAPAADGYHPLCSLMSFADIGDRLAAQPAETLRLNVDGPFAGALADADDNLVMRAARALLAEVRRPTALASLSLQKNLPVAAGLGGGSSDAGAALRLLRTAFEAPVSDARLQEIAATLGADGPACLWGAPVIAQGRGERLSPVGLLPVMDAVLVNPGVPVSTAEVYAAYDGGAEFGDVTPPPLPDTFENVAEAASWLRRQRNDLQASAVALAPEIGDVLQTLVDEPETLMARMSGSGSTVFAICGSDVEAEGLAERVEALAPNWWVRRCRLGGPWPDET